MPVAFSIAIGALIFIIDGKSTYIFVQRLISSTLSFPLLAVPFFIMTGVIMNHSGITRRIMNLADVLVGHLVGVCTNKYLNEYFNGRDVCFSKR